MPKSIAIIRTAPLLLARFIAWGLFLSRQPIAVWLFDSGCSVRLFGGYINGWYRAVSTGYHSIDIYIPDAERNGVVRTALLALL